MIRVGPLGSKVKGARVQISKECPHERLRSGVICFVLRVFDPLSYTKNCCVEAAKDLLTSRESTAQL